MASDIKTTSYTDNTIPKLAKYQYQVVAKASGYSSDATVSETAILGPAIEVPDTLLATEENFNLWKTVDADGDYACWSWNNPSPWSFGGAYSGYNYTDYAPANWLISPYIHLLKDKHYKITFEGLSLQQEDNRAVVYWIRQRSGYSSAGQHQQLQH